MVTGSQEESPDYLLKPQAQVSYAYDPVGNRVYKTDDDGTVQYRYDAANRLLSETGPENSLTYEYDALGNRTKKTGPKGTASYRYDYGNKLSEISFEDGTHVRYGYDALGRKATREEKYWRLQGPRSAQGWLHGQGHAKRDNLYREATESTQYIYDGLNVLKEYTGHGAPLGEYRLAEGRVLARKMFGYKGRRDQDREGTLHTRGGQLYYTHDAIGNVTALVDHLGEELVKYRYDVFGGLFTGISAPYNTLGLTSKSYDPKAGLIDFSARWYDPVPGRFTTTDPWRGLLDMPQTLNRYAYALNNPLKYVDPTGMVPALVNLPYGGTEVGDNFNSRVHLWRDVEQIVFMLEKNGLARSTLARHLRRAGAARRELLENPSSITSCGLLTNLAAH